MSKIPSIQITHNTPNKEEGIQFLETFLPKCAVTWSNHEGEDGHLQIRGLTQREMNNVYQNIIHHENFHHIIYQLQSISDYECQNHTSVVNAHIKAVNDDLFFNELGGIFGINDNHQLFFLCESKLTEYPYQRVDIEVSLED